MPITPDFGHWLAGFIDGEGHFAVYSNAARTNPRHRRPNCKCLFELGLRSDGAAILREIAQRTGLGRIYSKTSSGRPCTTWRIGRKAECLALVELLDRYPLRAKKARDYAIWREAVFAWQRLDFVAMEDAHRAIRAGRAYAAPARAPVIRRPAQMELL